MKYDLYFADKDIVEELGYFSILWGMAEKRFFGDFGIPCKLNEILSSDILPKRIKQDTVALAHSIRNELIAYLTKNYYSQEITQDTMIERLRPQTEKEIVTCRKWYSLNGKDDVEFVKYTFFACYRIRNNLFHGEKPFDLLHHQLDLFRAINAFLNNLIKR